MMITIIDYARLSNDNLRQSVENAVRSILVADTDDSLLAMLRELARRVLEVQRRIEWGEWGVDSIPRPRGCDWRECVVTAECVMDSELPLVWQCFHGGELVRLLNN